MIRIENRQPKAKRGYFAKFLNFKVAFYTKETTYVRIFNLSMTIAMTLFKKKK